MSVGSEVARRDFNRKTLAALSRNGIELVDAVYLPGADGSFANGERAYGLDAGGQYQIRRFLEVLALAGVR